LLRPDDGEGVSVDQVAAGDPRTSLLALYDTALPQVYGYLLHRCGRTALAEDLTAETFLAAVDAVRLERPPPISTAWLIGVARHKLVDHWRRQAREERSLSAVADDPTQGSAAADDPWDAKLDSLRAHETLESLAPQHRAALTLRYLDDLPVTDVAQALQRTLHATEALLVRARTAFRRAYSDPSGEGAGRD
jgi:RNA polymerase sigma-70 factor (ECF subfamily)